MDQLFSIWEKESFYASQDIIIIGAGLMGLWSALELKKNNPSLKITLLERNTTPLGASTRNAGFACFGSPTELIHDAETVGTGNMLSVVEMRCKGIEKIRAHFTTEEIGYDACGGYECINRDYKYWSVLDEKTHALNKALSNITGRENTFVSATEKLPALGLRGFDALIENKSEAALHSGKLVQKLTQKVQLAGVQILYGMDVASWENDGKNMVITTKNKTVLTAQKLLFSTNAFTQELLPSLCVTPARGQVIVTSPIVGLTMKGTFHFDEGFYYWRNLGDRILLGGARNTAFEAEHTTDLSGSGQIRDALEHFLADHLHPSFSYTIDHHWSGVMGFTADKKPFADEVSENVYAAVACNGIGVALTPVIAEKIAERMLQDF